jgi:hypothetical protein
MMLNQTSGEGARPRRSASDAAFDTWLQRGLQGMYGEVVQEPIPEELLHLIQSMPPRK